MTTPLKMFLSSPTHDKGRNSHGGRWRWCFAVTYCMWLCDVLLPKANVTSERKVNVFVFRRAKRIAAGCVKRFVLLALTSGQKEDDLEKVCYISNTLSLHSLVYLCLTLDLATSSSPCKYCGLDSSALRCAILCRLFANDGCCEWNCSFAKITSN